MPSITSRACRPSSPEARGRLPSSIAQARIRGARGRESYRRSRKAGAAPRTRRRPSSAGVSARRRYSDRARRGFPRCRRPRWERAGCRRARRSGCHDSWPPQSMKALAPRTFPIQSSSTSLRQLLQARAEEGIGGGADEEGLRLGERDDPLALRQVDGQGLFAVEVLARPRAARATSAWALGIVRLRTASMSSIARSSAKSSSSECRTPRPWPSRGRDRGRTRLLSSRLRNMARQFLR